LETKGMGEFSLAEGGKAAEYSEHLLMAIVWIDFLEHKFDHRALY
jgi:hypothetical protein